MKIIRVFPQRTSHTPTDDLAFIGEPPLPGFRPDADEVHVSVTFTWDMQKGRSLAEAWRQFYPVVRIGGPALGNIPVYFQPGRYVKQGIVFASRGCNNTCPWCLVPAREGQLQEIENFASGYIINDNNFLQCPSSHRQKVYQMLRQQRKGAVFAGGLQASLITDEIADELRSVRIGHIFLAADTEGSLKPLRAAVQRLAWLRSDTEKRRKRPAQRLQCYVLIGYNGETLEQAASRLQQVWEIGATPFAQLYQPPREYKIEYGKEWRELARTWQRPALMMRLQQGRERT